MVEIKNLSLRYALPGGKTMPALERVNARFARGKISVIVGPSGCGKTSLLRIIAGLVKADEGEVFADGKAVRGPRKNTAVIFQDYGLLPWKTVRANAELPLRFGAGRGGGGKAAALLSRFGLGEFSGCYPGQLSGGMKQRLAIVRALVMEPSLLLMDEPFSSLDLCTREEAQDFFLSVKSENGLTIVMVSHSVEEAVYLADTVYVMNGGNPGTIETETPVSRDGLAHAAFRETARFQEYCGALRNCLKVPRPAGSAYEKKAGTVRL